MLSYRLLLFTQWKMFWTSRLANEHIKIPSEGQSSPWQGWKQRKDKNLPLPTAFFVYKTHKSNAPVPRGALNYLSNWQSFLLCWCCTNRHFLRRSCSCREVGHTAYFQLFTSYNQCIVVGRIVLESSKPPGLYGLETKSSMLQRLEPRPIILHFYMQSYKGPCKEQVSRMQCNSAYNRE